MTAKIIHYFPNNPVQVNLMLDRTFTVFGVSSMPPKGGVKDWLGEMTLRDAIHQQWMEDLVWVQVVEYRLGGKPHIMAQYEQTDVNSEWNFYPEGVIYDAELY